MPHDTHGNVLSEGDEVVIRYIIRSIQRGIEYCNCQLESVYGRRPDGLAEAFSGNIGVCEKVLATPEGDAKLAEIKARPVDAWNAIKYPDA